MQQGRKAPSLTGEKKQEEKRVDEDKEGVRGDAATFMYPIPTLCTGLVVFLPPNLGVFSIQSYGLVMRGLA